MSKTLHIIMNICRFNFGVFEEKEFTKFLYMGLIFGLIIGVYWALRPLKDAVFIQLVDKMHLPYAKTFSVLALIPLVIVYTKLLELYPREKMLLILPAFYGIAALFFSVLIYIAQSHPAIAAQGMGYLIGFKVLGYIWYFFVESFGSLVIALFWAFAADTTDPTSAKRGFPLVVAIGQIGGVIFPYSVVGLPHHLGHKTDTLSIVVIAFSTLAIIPLVRYFFKTTPSYLLESFHGKNEAETKYEPGFLEGLKLTITHKYLLGIFFVNFIYEVIITIFDYNFKLAAAAEYSGVALSHYLSIYGSSVSFVSLVCLLLGISNITRFLGIGVALASMPVIVGVALLAFMNLHNLNFLFGLMVGSKAINFALNGPALKQLYIPTSPDVRFKAQAWIETFGSRASKEAGSLFNMILRPLQTAFGEVAGKAHYLAISGGLGFPLLAIWFLIALYLSKKYHQAIKENNMVC